MKLRCHVDIETYSEIDLKECGVYRYAEDPSTELLCLCYRFGKEGPVTCWLPFYKSESPSQLSLALETRFKADRFEFSRECPKALREHIEAGGEVAAHNAQFERTVLNGVAGKKLSFPRLQIKQMVCTAVKARTYGLPGALGDCAKALKTYPKDETGRGIMLKLCRPRSGKEKRYAIEDEIDDYVHLYAYCVDDVKAEYGVDAALPDITSEEREVYWLDQRCNDRGVGVDLGAIADVQSLIAEYKLELEQICLQKIGLRPSQREKIVDWVRAHGYPQIPDMQADTVLQAQSDPKCPDDVKSILALYAVYGMKAPTKYNAIEAAVCWDIRIRGMMFYYGAGTGRWSSIIVQLQNLYRPKINDADTAIELFAARDLEAVHWMYPTLDPMKVFASCVRGVLIPADGHDLIAMDYAGIESRVLAWMFDEEWKLEAFRRFDGNPKAYPDNYQITYGGMFGVEPLSVKKFERQIGKVCLAGDTLTLCESGWKRLDTVTKKDRVWDGEQWVGHTGLQLNGKRDVLDILGVSLTPDHLVLCGEKWITSQSLAGCPENIATALAKGRENLPSQAFSYAAQGGCKRSSSSVIADVPSTHSTPVTSIAESPRGVISARTSVYTKSVIGDTEAQCPTMNTDAGCSTDWHQLLIDVQNREIEAGIPTAVAAFRCAPNGVRTEPLFCGTSEPSSDGISRNLKWTEKTTTKDIVPATYDLRREETTRGTNVQSPASRRYALVYDLISVGSKNRFTVLSRGGPLLVHNCELALGYEGGVGAFVTMAPTYNVDLNVLAEKAYDNLPEWALEAAVWMWNNIERKRGYPSGLPEKVYLTIDGIKQVWRSMHPKVKQGWRDTLDAAKLAVKNPGKAYAIPTRKLMFQVKDRWLLMRLPSGRTLKYFEPVLHGLPTKKLEEYEKECELARVFGTEPPPAFGEEPELKKLSLHYMGVDSRTKRWMLESTYGGKLVENGDQGVSNCLLRKGLLRWDARGYWVVLSVHDEGVAEVPEGFGSLDEASSLLCTLDPWATGLPVTAEGWRGKRYRKS